MEDFISQLPDELLQLILLNFSMRDSVRTSVLSTRWENLWKGVPGLHLVDNVWTNIGFKDFISRFLNLQKESSPIYQFTLWCSDMDRYSFDEHWFEWLIEKVTTRGVHCFAFDGRMFKSLIPCMTKLPVSLYKCETLVHLCLKDVKLRDSEFFYLPRLETMHLVIVRFSSDVVLEELILCSPALQVLRIHDTTLGRLTLRSQTVKKLSLRSCFRLEAYDFHSSNGGEFEVVIDTPSLEILCIRGDLLENIRLESVSSSIKMCIDVCSIGNDYMFKISKVNMSRMQAFRNFFSRFSGVTDLTLSRYTLEGLYHDHSQPQQLPIFENLTHLNACFNSDFSEMLPMFLSSFPNLKSLDLCLYGYPNMDKIASSPVPQCFQTSIEYIEVKMMAGARQERSREAEMEFAKYILENATILKKLTLWLNREEDKSSSVLQLVVLRFPNRFSVEGKINRSPAKFELGYGFKFNSVFDPIASNYSALMKIFLSS